MDEIKLTEDFPSFSKRFKRYGVVYVKKNDKNMEENFIKAARNVVDNQSDIMYTKFKDALILKTEESFYNKDFLFRVFEIDTRTYPVNKEVKFVNGNVIS